MNNLLKTPEGHFTKRALERFVSDMDSQTHISPEDSADLAVKALVREIDEERDVKFKLQLSARHLING